MSSYLQALPGLPGGEPVVHVHGFQQGSHQPQDQAGAEQCKGQEMAPAGDPAPNMNVITAPAKERSGRKQDADEQQDVEMRGVFSACGRR
jgi:hypothetical protein